MEGKKLESCEGCRDVSDWQVTETTWMIFIDVTDKETIIETLAKDRRVEALVENIAHHSLTADLKDLCQMVYLILLEYDESKLQDLWENDQINFFIARIILNQYRSSNSPFHAIFRKYQERSLSIGDGISIDALDKII